MNGTDWYSTDGQTTESMTNDSKDTQLTYFLYPIPSRFDQSSQPMIPQNLSRCTNVTEKVDKDELNQSQSDWKGENWR